MARRPRARCTARAEGCGRNHAGGRNRVARAGPAGACLTEATAEMTAPSPRANRVTPFGTFEAVPQKGRFMGNRGILAPGRPWRNRAWLCCRLSFRGRRVAFDDPHHYTPLFFADEAVALAAGHRPCAECRRADYMAFAQAFRRAFAMAEETRLPAATIDRALHFARIRAGIEVTHPARLGTLPDGAFVTRSDAPRRPCLVVDGMLRPWFHAGYGPPEPAPPDLRVTVLTPAPTIAVLKAGYRPAGLEGDGRAG